MPHRFIHAAEHLWRWVVALYEPALFYAGIAGVAAFATITEAGSMASRMNGPWLELAAYLAGSFADLHFRGRAYAALPADQRPSRLREWKSRLGLAAIGLAGAFFASLAVHAGLDVHMPDMGGDLYPVVNFVLVLVAVPFIDGVRGLSRILSGQSAQDAFAGLVIGWAQKRAGRDDDGQDRGPTPPAGGAG